MSDQLSGRQRRRHDLGRRDVLRHGAEEALAHAVPQPDHAATLALLRDRLERARVHLDAELAEPALDDPHLILVVFDGTPAEQLDDDPARALDRQVEHLDLDPDAPQLAVLVVGSGQRKLVVHSVKTPEPRHAAKTARDAPRDPPKP
jgi:hypothetical protein